MTESRKAGFWLGLGLFQALFGLAVFGLTRHYYLSERDPALPRAASMPFPMTLPQASLDGAAPRPTAPGETAFESPELISQRADERFAARDYGEAAALYERLVALDPTNVALRNNLGLTLQYLGRSDEALQRLQEGLAIDPEHQRSWLTLGFVQAQLGNREQARTALANASRLGPDNDVGRSAARMLGELGLEVPLN